MARADVLDDVAAFDPFLRAWKDRRACTQRTNTERSNKYVLIKRSRMHRHGKAC